MPAEAPEATETQSTPEVVVEAPKFGGNPAQPVYSGVTVSDMLNMVKGKKSPEAEPAKEAPKTEPEKSAEPAKAKESTQTTPEAKKDPEQPAKGSKEDNMANMRKTIESLQKEISEFKGKHETLEKEYTEYKSKPFELPEEHKTKFTELEKQRDEYLKELRVVNLARDPEFVSRYDKPIQSNVELMAKIAKDAGIPEDDVRQGMGVWNENTFGEWVEMMNPAHKAKFTAAWIQSESLYNERNQRLQDSERTYSEIMKARETEAKTQQEAMLSQNTKLAKSILKEVVYDVDALKEYEDLPAAAESMAMRAARYEMPAEEVFKNVVANQVLSRVTLKQDATIKELRSTMEEKDKKIAELEEFVKAHAGATPRSETSGSISGGKQVGEDKPIWQRLDIRIP